MTTRADLLGSAGKLPTKIMHLPQRYILSRDFMGTTTEGKPYWLEGRVDGDGIDFWQTDGINERRVLSSTSATICMPPWRREGLWSRFLRPMVSWRN